jgi:hemoglobin
MSEAVKSPYQRLGGDAGVKRHVERIYQRMDSLPEAAPIRARHADDLAPMIDKLGVFLIGWMGGPENYRERFGSVVIPAAHEPFDIGADERDLWLLCMHTALTEADVDAELSDLLMDAFARMAEMCRTDGER